MKCFNEFESSCLCFFFFNDTIIWLDDAFYVLLISFLLLFLLLHFTVTRRGRRKRATAQFSCAQFCTFARRRGDDDVEDKVKSRRDSPSTYAYQQIKLLRNLQRCWTSVSADRSTDVLRHSIITVINICLRRTIRNYHSPVSSDRSWSTRFQEFLRSRRKSR